jgi:S1-C subfamily serine protease
VRKNSDVTESLILDVLLLLMLLGYVAYGFRNGLSRSVFTIAGIIAGIIAAFFLTPVIVNLVPIPFLRLGVTIAVAVGFVAIGHAIGSAIGRWIRRGILRGPLSGLDRVLGAVVTGVVAALVASMVAFSVGQLGVPVLSRAIAGSTFLRIVNTLTPDPVESFLAQVRSAVVDRGIPLFTGALDGTPTIPQIDTGSGALNAAAQSVVRITGNAYACGVSQAGTGFVVYDDRVVTNAHVVAGVTEPVVETLAGQSLTGTVVYFDPIDDLAVIAVPGLDAAALPLAATLAAGTDAAVEGYPYGGPFSSGAANVISVSSPAVPDIYGATRNQREVYTLAADIREGNSGGPLLTLDGSVAGVVFARSGDTTNVGYAMTMTELEPVTNQAAGLTEAVSSGACVSG